jgi:hypothetical protein
MKNVAVLYYGIHQGYCFNECFLNFKEKVIEPNKKEYNFDIFMHRWVYDDSHKDWLPWYNSDRINDESIKIDEDFLLKEVKPKIIKKEPFIDFTLKKYNDQIGENYFYEHYLLKSKKSKKYIVYNMVSRFYSIMQVNNIKNKYEKDKNINYDIVVLQESYNYYFDELKLDKINLNTLNICGLWPKNLIVPTFFKTISAGYKTGGFIHDILVIGNSEKINLFCNLYNKLNLYLELPLLKTEYKDYNYHQSEYIIYNYLEDLSIKYKRFGFLVGIFRKNGVKLTINQVPFDKLRLVNLFDRQYKKMPKDARDYI